MTIKETKLGKQAELFEKYDSAVKEVNAAAEVEAFSYGFRLGVRLMIETGVPLKQ